MIEACGRGDRAKLTILVRDHLPLAKNRYLHTYDDLLERGGTLALQA